MKTKIFLFIPLLTFFISCCIDGKCTDEGPDLVMPPYLYGEIPVYQSTIPTYLGYDFYNASYTYPLDIYLTYGARNEFYSTLRYDFYGNPVAFYWNESSPPPFSNNSSDPLFQKLKIGEEILVHRCIFNEAPISFDLDCYNTNQIKTEMEVIVKVQNGRIVDKQIANNNTPKIPVGQYRVIAIPYVLNALGKFELKFKVNSDNAVNETNINNNELIDLSNDNLGGGV